MNADQLTTIRTRMAAVRLFTEPLHGCNLWYAEDVPALLAALERIRTETPEAVVTVRNLKAQLDAMTAHADEMHDLIPGVEARVAKLEAALELAMAGLRQVHPVCWLPESCDEAIADGATHGICAACIRNWLIAHFDGEPDKVAGVGALAPSGDESPGETYDSASAPA